MKKSLTLVALISGLGMALWSPASYACAVEPYVASVCVMAVSPSRFPGIGSTYQLAMGQTLAISQNAALFSLLGTTFGGNGSSTFNLPDLRGKVIVGYDPTNPSSGYVGASGGSASIKLTVAQLPPHVVSFNVPVSLAGVSAQTTLTGLNATANLGGVVISGPATGLTVKVASGSNGVQIPTNAYLGKAVAATSAIYSNATPDATLNPGTIGGTLSLTVGQGVTAPVAITGAAQTTLSGNATASGNSNVVGGGADVPTMPPFLVMPYYIAITGVYPSSN